MRAGIVHGADDARFMISRDTDILSGLVVPLLDKSRSFKLQEGKKWAMASTSTLIKRSRLPE